MPLDAQIKALDENLPGGLKLTVGEPADSRERFRKVNTAMRDHQPPANLAATEDIFVPGAVGDHPARIYRPHANGATPTIVFVHGGGFVVGDVEGYDLQARTLAEKTAMTVLSVEYRLAPEDPFPAGADDVESIARWALGHVDRLGGDPSRVILAGDSAGGNLSAVTALALTGESPGFKGLVLIYPVVDFDGEYASLTENADGPLLTADACVWFHSHYVSSGADTRDPRMSPLLADNLASLPPTIVTTAGFDPLRDQGAAMADALQEAGVLKKHLHYDSLPHGFLGLGPLSTGCMDAIDELCEATRALADNQ